MKSYTEWFHILRSFALFLLIAATVSACAEFNSIYRSQPISTRGETSQTAGRVITVDAKQRHLLVAPELDSENKLTKWRMCAEAAPDVFSAYAASLAAKGSKSGGELSFGSSETAATIERTQTVNLLRESMYRTCERYLSGGLEKEQLIVQAARDQRSLVAVLAVEQLTGAIRAKPTIISGPATSASIVDGEKIAELIKEYSGTRDQAKKDLAAASADFDKVKDKGKCADIEKKPEDVADKDWSDCTTAKVTLAQRTADLKVAEDRLDKVLDLANKAVTQLQASTSAGSTQGEALSPNRPSDLAIVAVAQSIEKIVQSPGIDESLMFCIAYFSSFTDPNARARCLAILATRANDDRTARAKLLGIPLAEPVDPVRFSTAAAQGRLYNAFRSLLVAGVKITPVANLPAKMAAFEQAAKTNFQLGNNCKTAAQCEQAIDASDLADAYQSRPGDLEAALSVWSKP